LAVAAVFGSRHASHLLDEGLAHGLGGGAEVGAVVPLLIGGAQAQSGFMH
jgi:hypothetical protein